MKAEHEASDPIKTERTFPIQGSYRGEAKPYPRRIPWALAEEAYSVYSSRYGTEQTLERLAQRGGFGTGEMDSFIPDWRERCDVINKLQSENAQLLAETLRLRQALELARHEMVTGQAVMSAYGVPSQRIQPLTDALAEIQAALGQQVEA